MDGIKSGKLRKWRERRGRRKEGEVIQKERERAGAAPFSYESLMS